MDWKNFPKTELHIHLEGAAPVSFIRKQSAKKGIDISHAFDGDRYLWKDFDEFLKTYEAVMSVLTTPEDFADLTRAVLEEQRSHGVIYTELTLGPILMSDNDPIRWQEMLAAIEEAGEGVEGITARYTAVIVRHFGVERGIETAELVAKHQGRFVTGFGMAGAEQFGRPSDFTRAFDIAGDAGLGLTVHAGEWCAPDMIEESISSLKVSRLGHGVRSVESMNTIAMIKDRDIHLEVNPGSNVSLGASKSWETHQIHRLKELDVSVSISTDDPPYFDTTMTNEYEQLSRLGWSESELRKTNLEAMRHAFVDDKTRQSIIERL